VITHVEWAFACGLADPDDVISIGFVAIPVPELQESSVTNERDQPRHLQGISTDPAQRRAA
jgi:hypothetical protein